MVKCIQHAIYTHARIHKMLSPLLSGWYVQFCMTEYDRRVPLASASVTTRGLCLNQRCRKPSTPRAHLAGWNPTMTWLDMSLRRQSWLNIAYFLRLEMVFYPLYHVRSRERLHIKSWSKQVSKMQENLPHQKKWGLYMGIPFPSFLVRSVLKMGQIKRFSSAAGASGFTTSESGLAPSAPALESRVHTTRKTDRLQSVVFSFEFHFTSENMLLLNHKCEESVLDLPLWLFSMFSFYWVDSNLWLYLSLDSKSMLTTII